MSKFSNHLCSTLCSSICGKILTLYRRIYRTPDNKPNANYLFVVGTPGETSGFTSSWKLEYEIAVYDDILIVDFPDVYNNLPLKTKAMLEFAQSYCKDIEYFYFHDSGKFHPQSTKRGARIALG